MFRRATGRSAQLIQRHKQQRALLQQLTSSNSKAIHISTSSNLPPSSSSSTTTTTTTTATQPQETTTARSNETTNAASAAATVAPPVKKSIFSKMHQEIEHDRPMSSYSSTSSRSSSPASSSSSSSSSSSATSLFDSLVNGSSGGSSSGAEASISPFVKGREEEIMRQERALLTKLLESLNLVDADPLDIELLERSSSHLDDLFMMVVVGEFNSGKSSFINALLGDRYLKEGITPTTGNLHLIRYGGSLNEDFDRKTNVVNLELPLKWLQGISVVDTPGTNAIIKEHQQITEHFVPRSDLIIFLTSAERPFSESEHNFMESIRKWGKKVIVCVNKYDLLATDADRNTIDKFVSDGISKLLGFNPILFGVSSRQAFNWKQDKQVNSFMASSLEDSMKEIENKPANPSDPYDSITEWKRMEAHILKTLTSVERIQLKLLNPLGVAENLTQKYLVDVIESRLKVLREDRKTVDVIEDQLQLFIKEMKKDFQLQQQRLDNILHEMTERGNDFFEDFLQLSNITDLLKKDVVTNKFEQEVIRDVIPQMENHISEVIDWIIDRKYRQWKAVTDFVYKRARVSTNEENLVGSLKSDFNFNRKELLLNIGSAAENVVESYDKYSDTVKLNNEIMGTLKSVTAVSIGAVGAGAAAVLLTPTLSSAAFGIFGAAAVLAGGLYILPFKRARMRKDFVKQVELLRQQLHSVMNERFNQELNDSVDSIRAAISPYSSFVVVEYEKFLTQKKNLQEIASATDSIRKSIEALAPGNTSSNNKE